MKPWKWILLLLLSFIGMTILCALTEMISEMVHNVYAAGTFAIMGSALMCLIYGRLSAVIEKRSVYELRTESLFSDTAKGWIVGGGAMAISVLVLWVVGVYQIHSVSPQWEDIFHGLFFYLIVAVGEELIFRAILLRMIEERWGTTIALILSCFIFGFAHYTNDGGTVWSSIAIAITAIEAGSFIYSRTLWMPIGAHWAWNFVQGNMLGISVSGNKIDSSLIQPSLTGPEWLTGGEFGVEASVITVIIATAVAAWFIWLAYKNGDYISFRCPWNLARKNKSNT